MRKDKLNELYKELSIEMFRRVGLNKTYSEIKEYAKQSNWYHNHSWSQQEQEEFVKWVVVKLRSELKCTKKYAEKQAYWFVFDIGWKLDN